MKGTLTELALLAIASLIFPKHYMIAGISTLAWLTLIFIALDVISVIFFTIGISLNNIIGSVMVCLGTVVGFFSPAIAMYFAWRWLPGFAFGGIGSYLVMSCIMVSINFGGNQSE